ncbi:DUF805 domain-containing protein [Levilactobacillus cerevisiae]|uniref:DUF805 domain-containing protein n=1 Tax=Levilactobacillus cerevisiae TaxID=1704076 RepID=UPI00345E72D5
MHPSHQRHSLNWLKPLRVGVQDAFQLNSRLDRANFWWLILDLVLLNSGLLITLLNTILQYPAFRFQPAYFNPAKVLLLFVISLLTGGTTIVGFTATVRRLHDTNRSGHYLWWLLLPGVGPCLVLVRLLAPSKALIKFSETHVSGNHPWRHQVAGWLLLFLATVAYAGFFNAFSTAALTVPNHNFAANGHRQSTTTTEYLALGKHQISIASQQAHPTTNRNISWGPTTFTIDRLTVYKTYGPYSLLTNDGRRTINGLIKVHMKIHAGRALTTYPAQGTLLTNDGQLLRADLSNSDWFAGMLNKGINTAGNIYFLVPHLNKPTDLTKAHFSWTAANQAINGQQPMEKQFSAVLDLAH